MSRTGTQCHGPGRSWAFSVGGTHGDSRFHRGEPLSCASPEFRMMQKGWEVEEIQEILEATLVHM